MRENLSSTYLEKKLGRILQRTMLILLFGIFDTINLKIYMYSILIYVLNLNIYAYIYVMKNCLNDGQKKGRINYGTNFVYFCIQMFFLETGFYCDFDGIIWFMIRSTDF